MPTVTSKYSEEWIDVDRSVSSYMPLEAAATALDGFVVRQDYMPVIKRYVREETVLWQMIRKEKADADVIKEIIEPYATAPNAGFVDRATLNPVENSATAPNYDLADPGQQNKAIGGVIKFPHYTRSLHKQQGLPWGDQIARKTERLMVSTLLTLEMSLFTGNATTNPLSFNGIENQMPLANVSSIDIRAGKSVVKSLRSIVRKAISNKQILKKITHIFTSALGIELIEIETDMRLAYRNMEVIRPGLQVPQIVTQAGNIPLMQSPYIDDITYDLPNPDPRDEVVYYLINLGNISWKGVIPEGGIDTFEPQLFDVSKQELSLANPYLLEKRMSLIYGTLYVENRGASIFKLIVKVPAGTVAGI
jgi:hypothetical protein